MGFDNRNIVTIQEALFLVAHVLIVPRLPYEVAITERTLVLSFFESH